ncbi:hypothetical protein, partial [Bacillus cereus]|uniref:hypothetical protein n=1 Tax=Bacillus cereus TaxID=1396 RepID=UPI000C01BEC5
LIKSVPYSAPPTTPRKGSYEKNILYEKIVTQSHSLLAYLVLFYPWTVHQEFKGSGRNKSIPWIRVF